MAKKPGPKGKKSKNRMTGAEVEAANAAFKQNKQADRPVEGTNIQKQDPVDVSFTEPAIGEGEATVQEDTGGEATEDREQTDGELAGGGDAELTDKLVDGAAGPIESEDDKVPNSVVKDKFKKKYIENAKAGGFAGKAAKRSNWDWLAQTIAEQCLDDKAKININQFVDLLDANGVDHSRWTNRNKGWEGRFRMTGRVALQKIVAANGELKTMTGSVTPPADWIAKYKAKV